MTGCASSLEEIVRAGIPDGCRKILIAVSGGVDSVVLLTLLVAIRDTAGLQLSVAHLDHQLRPESRRDADFVASLANKYSLDCHERTIDIAQLSRQQRVSHEMAGRSARRIFLQEIAEQEGADLIALAHHQDDQAETLLMRLIRGTGVSGLGAMSVRQSLWWRPLLPISRKQILDYAQRQGLSWVEDASNQNTAYDRNLLRSEVVPLLRRLNPQSDEKVCRLAEQVRLEETFWQDAVEKAMTALNQPSDVGIALHLPQLLNHHKALRLRLYREALLRVRGNLEGIGALHLEQIDALAESGRGQSQIDLPGAWVAKRYGELWLRISAPSSVDRIDDALPVPGVFPLEDGQKIVASLRDLPGEENSFIVEFDCAQLDGPVRVRNWRAGDRFVPSGMAGHKKIKRFLSENRISHERRSETLIVTSGETILWVVGMRRSAHAPTSADCRRILRLELL